jgi:hypothetical protein
MEEVRLGAGCADRRARSAKCCRARCRWNREPHRAVTDVLITGSDLIHLPTETPGRFLIRTSIAASGHPNACG